MGGGRNCSNYMGSGTTCSNQMLQNDLPWTLAKGQVGLRVPIPLKKKLHTLEVTSASLDKEAL